MKSIGTTAFVFVVLFAAVAATFSSSGASAPACIPPPSGLVGWWSGDGHANDIQDENDGSLVNGAAFGTGIIGQAFLLDGSDDHIRVPDSAGLDITNQLSLEGWIYPTAFPVWATILAKWDAVWINQRSYSFGLDSTGRAYFRVSPDGDEWGFSVGTVFSNSEVPLSQWTHVAGTYDGAIMRIYVNGELSNQVDYDQGIYSSSSDLALGAAVGGVGYGSLVYPFAGLLDEASIYDRALAISEIQDIFLAGSAGKCKATYSIAGRVTSDTSEPIAGGTVSADAGHSATTDATGAYTVTGLTTGPHTLTPSKPGWTFTPPTRTVSVPPDATGQDFTGTRVGPQAAQPIILVHGFSMVGDRPCSGAVHYSGAEDPFEVESFDFHRMAGWLDDLGYDVWIAHLQTGFRGTPLIEANAERCLKPQIAEVRQRTGRKAVVIAHSMGGLVSRACLNLDKDQYECRNNVDALYTLGSPHVGINGAFLLKIVAPVVPKHLLCKWHPALCQFSTERIGVFNIRQPNHDSVGYHFVGGDMTPPVLFGWLLEKTDGPHDGRVGSHSAAGWEWFTRWNMVPGAAASRHWVDENHSEDIGYPSYFEVHGGPGSQAYRCMVSQLEGEQPNPEDCEPASAQDLSVVQDKPELSAATAEVSGHLGSGQTVRPTLEMDASERSLFHLAWVTGTLTFTLTQPNGQVVSPAYAEAHPDVVTYTTSSGGDTLSPSAAYAFTTTVPGLYTATITADEVGAAGTDFLFAAALETSRVLTVTTNAELYQVGDTAVFTGSLRGPSGGITGADVQAQLGRLDGITDTLAFADLGNGKYGAAYAVPDVPGHLQATFTAVGDDGGTAFTRQVEALLAIAPYAAQLTGAYSDRPEDWDGDGFDDMLALDLGMTATEVGTHTLSADLVSGGQVIAHATHNTVLDSGVQTVTIRFDGWDIRRSGIDGPYTVTHVYLLDVGAGGIPSQVADDVWVTAAYGWHDFGFESQHLPLILKKH